MTDIEFDEIDKAVSSALGEKPVKNTDESVAFSRGKTSSEIHVRSLNSKTLKRGPLSSRHANGRFMDVVHPSSDMKATTKAEPTGKPVYNFPSGAVEPSLTTESTDDTGSEPMASPFLSDAKVEKRPLGAFSEVSQPEPEETSNVDTDIIETPMPPEFNHDVMSLETNHVREDTPGSGEVEEEPQENEAQTPEAPEPSREEKSDEIEPPVPSIIQQYQEKPSTTSDQSGAIFDTEHYHAPLTHAPKKKSGWMVVIWILALIIIGAGLGAAAYYFVLPNLL